MRGLRAIKAVGSVRQFAWDNGSRQFIAIVVQDANGYYARVNDSGPQ